MKKGSAWPWVIGGALALHIVVSLVVVAIATSDASYAVEEDYYRKAVNWDQKRAQDRINEELGWSLEFNAKPPQQPGERPALEVRLTDYPGHPIADASIALEAFHKARSDDVLRLAIAATGEPGLYAASPAMQHNGLWELRFTVTRGAVTFTHSETRHLFVEGTWK